MRCCGNCEWCLDEDIEREYDCDLSVVNESKVGDCALNIDHDGKFLCDEHVYISNKINNYVMYDNYCYGEGFLIVSEYEGEAIKYIKLYKSNDGFPSYSIFGFELPFGTGKILRDIEIKIYKDEIKNRNIIEAFVNFSKRLGNGVIREAGILSEGESCFSVIDDFDCVILRLSKDKCKDNRDFIGAYLGDYYCSENYSALSLLFMDLTWHFGNKTDKDKVMKVLKISR